MQALYDFNIVGGRCGMFADVVTHDDSIISIVCKAYHMIRGMAVSVAAHGWQQWDFAQLSVFRVLAMPGGDRGARHFCWQKINKIKNYIFFKEMIFSS